MKKSRLATALICGLIGINAAAQGDFLPMIFPKMVRVAQHQYAKEAAARTPVPPPVPFASSASYQVCFVPEGLNCEALLIKAINETRQTLLIQAYSFTSAPIAKAVARAHQRGVTVRVILDKSQKTEKYTSATFLKNAGIPVVIDDQPAIAHNKIMIFDSISVFTGSFNFTSSAAQRNTENGMLIHGDRNIVQAYEHNWKVRLGKSTAY